MPLRSGQRFYLRFCIHELSRMPAKPFSQHFLKYSAKQSCHLLSNKSIEIYQHEFLRILIDTR